MSRLVAQIRLSALYFLVPALGALSPLIVIPALTHRYGAAGWAAVAIAQSLGMAAAVIAELGWGVIGPQRVARADAAERMSLYESAFATKLAAVCVLAPVAALASFVLATSHKDAAALIGFAMCAGALSPSWFLMGCNKPMAILRVETIPRLCLTVAAGLAIYLGAPLEIYGVAILTACAVTVVLGARIADQRLWPQAKAFREGAQVIRQQLPITFGRVISVIYTSLPIALVSTVSPASVASFAAIDRLTRMFLNLLNGVPSRLQSWVGTAPEGQRHHRSRRSLAYNAIFGLGSALFFLITAPFAARYLFSSTVTISFAMASVSAVIVLVVCASRGYGLSLVAEEGANWIAVANIGAALVGVCAILGLASAWGAIGGLVGELLCELTGLGIQVLALHFGRQWMARRREGQG